MVAFMSETVLITVVNVVVGGIAVKMLEYFTARRKTETEEIARYHATLAEEIRVMREQLKQCNRELDDWQAKYYESRKGQ